MPKEPIAAYDLKQYFSSFPDIFSIKEAPSTVTICLSGVVTNGQVVAKKFSINKGTEPWQQPKHTFKDASKEQTSKPTLEKNSFAELDNVESESKEVIGDESTEQSKHTNSCSSDSQEHVMSQQIDLVNYLEDTSYAFETLLTRRLKRQRKS